MANPPSTRSRSERLSFILAELADLATDVVDIDGMPAHVTDDPDGLVSGGYRYTIDGVTVEVCGIPVDCAPDGTCRCCEQRVALLSEVAR